MLREETLAIAASSALEEKLRARTAVVGVIGLGYVGLPLLAGVGRAGFPAVGFDIDGEKISSLEAGRSYIARIPDSALARFRRNGGSVTSDFSRLREADAILVCVPTPLAPTGEPDLSFIQSTAAQIAAAARPGQIVVLESTTYPGTTEEILLPAIEARGLVLDRDFYLAFSPEREDPSNADFTLENIPKVVGGVTRRSGELAAMLYRNVVARVVPVADARVAEASKLVENIFRSVNIALVNELKICFDGMGIDIWDVLDAAATKPFGFMRFDPGPGWGGHCIPVDPFYLTWKARQHGISTRFVELAGEINVRMPAWVLGKLDTAVREKGGCLEGSRILILGVAYKRNVDDIRESPALEILEMLASRGARVAYHDPHVPRLPRTRRHDLDLSSVALTERSLSESDAVVVVTDHDVVDYRAVAAHAGMIVDTRSAFRRRHITCPPGVLVQA